MTRSTVTISLLVTLAVSSPATGQSPASDAGAQAVRAQCLGCHAIDLIAQQRLSRAGWDRVVAKMERWSAPIAAAERAALVEHLARRFAVRPAAYDADAVAAGQAVFARACLTCHNQALMEQQRLSDEGWRRSIAKMVRWGAAVDVSETAALAAYLTSLTWR